MTFGARPKSLIEGSSVLPGPLVRRSGSRLFAVLNIPHAHKDGTPSLPGPSLYCSLLSASSGRGVLVRSACIQWEAGWPQVHSHYRKEDMSPSSDHYHLRSVDVKALATTPISERVSQRLIDRESGGKACSVAYVRTPPGGGSPAGLHVHAVDQHFFVIEGVMKIEVDGNSFEAHPGSLVYFPAGVAHRNWNDGPVPTVHLAINAPLPAEGQRFAEPAP